MTCKRGVDDACLARLQTGLVGLTSTLRRNFRFASDTVNSFAHCELLLGVEGGSCRANSDRLRWADSGPTGVARECPLSAALLPFRASCILSSRPSCYELNQLEGDNRPACLAQRERIIEGMRLAGVAEE